MLASRPEGVKEINLLTNYCSPIEWASHERQAVGRDARAEFVR